MKTTVCIVLTFVIVCAAERGRRLKLTALHRCGDARWKRKERSPRRIRFAGIIGQSEQTIAASTSFYILINGPMCYHMVIVLVLTDFPIPSAGRIS